MSTTICPIECVKYSFRIVFIVLADIENLLLVWFCKIIVSLAKFSYYFHFQSLIAISFCGKRFNKFSN